MGEESIPVIIKKKKKVEGSARLQGEVDKIVEEAKAEADPYAMWSDPKPWEFQTCLATLHELIFRLHPKLFICVPHFVLERIRTDNQKVLDEYYRQSGGWLAVERDMKKAEKWILELYGIEEGEEDR